MDKKINIEFNEETFTKLLNLSNIYSQTLSEYNKVLFTIINMPRTKDGNLLLDESALAIMSELIIDYASIREVATKLETNPTVH